MEGFRRCYYCPQSVDHKVQTITGPALLNQLDPLKAESFLHVVAGKSWRDLKHEEIQCAIAGFEDGGATHQPLLQTLAAESDSWRGNEALSPTTTRD